MMLQYRLARIPGAEYKAQTYRPPFGGAMFAWESAVTGVELAPSPWGVYEDHISSDIALALLQFWRATLDNSGGFLNNTAWPILRGVARFWMSKLALDNPDAPVGSPLSIRSVMGPDEYHYPVNNSAFTNAGAIISLRTAVLVSGLLGGGGGGGGGGGVSPGEVAAWADAAERVAMPFDAARNYHPEFDGYTYGEQVKQADTVLLGFPLEVDFNMTPAVRANDLIAYGGKNTDPGGPAMTWSAFAIGYVELTRTLGPQYADSAAAMLNASFQNNVKPPFDVWSETPGGGCPNFLTGAGGFLQAAFNGYTGLRVNLTAATLNGPSLPPGATTTTLRGLAYLGNRVTISYDVNTISITLVAPPSAETLDALALRPELRVRYRAPSIVGADVGAAAPLAPLSRRSQLGRVVLGGGALHVVPPRALTVVDAAGGVHALAAGAPVLLPLQTISLVGAPAACRGRAT
jgi:hypothetical protein